MTSHSLGGGKAAVQLYRRHSLERLVGLRGEVERDPRSKEGVKPGDLYLYNREARKRLGDIDWAITWHLGDRRRGA